jgi:hypothetical protein
MEISELWFLTHPNVQHGRVVLTNIRSTSGSRMAHNFNKREGEKRERPQNSLQA